MLVRSPGKINLHLRVFPPAGGFHPLRSWFRTIDLADTLRIERAAGFSLACDDPNVPTDGSNLIAKAFRLLDPPGGAAIRLTKRLPVGGGVGGGSSNAAAALLGLAKLFGLPTPTVDQAAALGSDVPFFLDAIAAGRTDATCTGRGEVVEAFEPRRRHTVLLLLPGLQSATPAVFRHFDTLPPPPDDDAPDFATWSALPAIELLPRLRNDLQPAAFALHPALAEVHAAAERALGRRVLLTGSGSSLFTLYDDPAEVPAVELPARHRVV